MPSENVQRQSSPLHGQLGYIGEEELFDLIGVKKGTGRNRQSIGTLPPHYKIGRKKLYKVEEVKAWIGRQRVSKSAVR